MASASYSLAIDGLEVLPGKETVAGLAGPQNHAVERDELIRAIKAACISFMRPSDEKNLAMYDNDTLRGLVYVTRRMCRHADS
jgi:hypothetical protein